MKVAEATGRLAKQLTALLRPSVLAYDILATAILDRLLHHCDVFATNRPSYRLRDRMNLIHDQGMSP